MIKEIIFSGNKYIAVDVIRATKKIRGNNNTNRAFLFQYDGKSMTDATGISDAELWGSQTPSLTIGKQINVGGILYDQIVACDSRPEAVGFYVYDSDLVPYNWGGKTLLAHVWQALRAFTTRKAADAL